MRLMRLILACAAGACLLLLVASYLSAQIPSSIPYTGQYNRGQDVVPVFEGWKPNPDGTFTMYFGYFNRNYQEELDIPRDRTTASIPVVIAANRRIFIRAATCF